MAEHGSVRLTLDNSQALVNLERAADVFGRYTKHWHRSFGSYVYGTRYRRHRRHCRVCNPAGFPRPLPINGHEYHRRTRNRRKSKRGNRK
ncbi:MAG TPA: hypothetical protein VFF37_06620 [Streptomyces sp.]|nr:hypothetical protein [Streptomyces sp.]